jgi:hypothetical protein
MGNEWNNFFDKLSNAGAQFWNANIEADAKDDALTVYRTAMDNIKKTISSSQETSPKLEQDGEQKQDGVTTDQDPMQFVNKLFKGGVDENAGLEQNIQNLQSANVDMENLPGLPKQRGGVENLPGKYPTTKGEGEQAPFDVFWQGITDLLGKGKYGEPYIPLLNTYYEGTKPVTPKVKTEISNGFLLQYDDGGNIIKKTKIDDTPKELKNTIEKYQGMSYEDALKLTDNELSGDAFYYLPKEVQTKLMETFPALQQMHDAKFKEGDFSPKFGSVHKKLGSGKMNFADDRVKDLGEQLYKVNKIIEGRGGLNKLDEFKDKELIGQYNDLLAELDANNIGDPQQWANDIAGGKKFKDAMQEQEQFKEDYNAIVEGEGGLHNWLQQMYSIDTSKTGALEYLQKNRFEMEKYVNKISGKLDYQLAMKIYNYVNSELEKLYQSKGLGQYYK